MTIFDNPRSDRVRYLRTLSGLSARRKQQKFLIEGPQSLREAVLFAADLIQICYFTEDFQNRYPEIASAAKKHAVANQIVSQEVAAAISADCQGGVAVANFLAQPEPAELFSKDGVVAVLNSVQNPGNLGTVIRAADAVGANGVVISENSVDLYNPKVVRSTAGSLFHLPIITGVSAEIIASAATEANHKIWAAAGEASATLESKVFSEDARANQFPKRVTWFFGNEAKGLSEAEKSLADELVAIQIVGNAESLNLATAATICLHQTAAAQRFFL